MNFTRGLLLAALLVSAQEASAQRTRPEFTQQILLVAPLYPATVQAQRTARQVAGGLRRAIARQSPRRELAVVGTDTVEILLERAGFRPDTTMGEDMTLMLARRMRADEVVVGSVSAQGGVIEVKSELALMRDWRLRQPLPVVRGPTVGSVVDSLAAHVVRARAQMTGLRRCENAARAGDPRAALRHAEEAIALYPAATLARTCLTMVLRYNDVGAEYIAKATGELLALAPKNIIAAVLRANALSSLDRPREAATAWELVFDLRPDSLPLAIPAVEELMRLQQHQAVLRATEKLLATHKEDLPLRRLRFRAQIALKSWADAAALGDSLTVLDGEFDADSTYTARHVEALRLSGDTLSALARAARAVKQHPADLSIYLQYLNLINSENTTALPRGLERFPESSELNVIAAREAVSAGRRRAAIASLGTAVRQDPTLMQGFLQMAELWFEEQQPDSGIVAILRAPRTGTTDLLRAYSISRGRQMLRSATDTTTVGWRRSLALFALADSLESQAETRALIAAVTLSLARAELVIAIPLKDCPGVRRAQEALDIAASALDRGVGDSGDTAMREAFAALGPPVQNGVTQYCAPPN